jgi:uncharacterized protein YcbK (DUF882 family)
MQAVRATKLVIMTLAITAGLAKMSGSSAANDDVRSLKFYHTHTQRSLEVTYYRGGRYDAEGLEQIRQFLADWRDGDQLDLDPGLFDILWNIERATGHSDTWEVISAYRSPKTNEMLRARSSGVAKNSQHLLGRAIDVRLRGLDLAMLRDTAKELEMGGVGYYPGSDFVHVDTGRIRYW